MSLVSLLRRTYSLWPWQKTCKIVKSMGQSSAWKYLRLQPLFLLRSVGLLKALQQCKGTINVFFLLFQAGLVLFSHCLKACLRNSETQSSQNTTLAATRMKITAHLSVANYQWKLKRALSKMRLDIAMGLLKRMLGSNSKLFKLGLPGTKEIQQIA